MKKVLMLGTGGTIASEVTPSGLAPALTSAELLRCVPEISSLCSVTCEELFSIDSTNVTPAHWLTIARAIRAHYEEYDGFVIAHGTDTMAYTAAALSYLIQYSPKPIILTGAQKPIVFENTDSKTNLADAFRCAVSDLCGVMIVFNGRVILGTRARKTRTVSLQAFSSINYPELAVLQNGFLMEYIRPSALPAPVFYDKLGERVGESLENNHGAVFAVDLVQVDVHHGVDVVEARKRLDYDFAAENPVPIGVVFEVHPEQI